MDTTEVLNVPVSTYTKEESSQLLLGFLSENRNHILITPNPEIVLEARKDPDLMRIIKSADLVVPDGIGVVIASKFNKVKIPERVAGYDLIQGLFNNIKDGGATVYLLGGGKGVAELAAKNMMRKYKGLNIIGVNDGYFDGRKEKLIIEEINRLKPDILLLGLGYPKQEKFADKYKSALPVKLTCCIGGSFDVMSGKTKRAPELFQKLNLEWFYRLITEPSRFFRMLRLPLFMFIVIKEKLFGGN
ncbi:MAG: WecB/TagA/CpsF family glycosyltransferase [Clostridiales bacterium]|jgi:N-acetylglucosaminyldiphosphoundecaprenol N-acetyl-beta-D-mannosaminyltransferase|nr:WecB/TagA/CpsF family glycosyltransferase [Clostridiales bacterium]